MHTRKVQINVDKRHLGVRNIRKYVNKLFSHLLTNQPTVELVLWVKRVNHYDYVGVTSGYHNYGASTSRIDWLEHGANDSEKTFLFIGYDVCVVAASKYISLLISRQILDNVYIYLDNVHSLTSSLTYIQIKIANDAKTTWTSVCNGRNRLPRHQTLRFRFTSEFGRNKLK